MRMALSLLFECPEWFGAADDCADRKRPEIPAIKRAGLVPVHEKELAVQDEAATLPGRKWTTTAIMFASHPHRDSVDHDEQPVSADGLTGHTKNTLDQRNTARKITSFREKARERLRCIGYDQVGRDEATHRTDGIEPDRNAL